MGQRYIGIPLQGLVSEACNNGDWVLRKRRKRVYAAVYEKIENAQQPDEASGQDVKLWKHNEDDYKDTFSTQRTRSLGIRSESKLQWSDGTHLFGIFRVKPK